MRSRRSSARDGGDGGWSESLFSGSSFAMAVVRSDEVMSAISATASPGVAGEKILELEPDAFALQAFAAPARLPKTINTSIETRVLSTTAPLTSCFDADDGG